MNDSEIKQLIKQEIAGLNIIPVGAIFAFPSENIPENYLPCEGQELAKSQYPELFKLIGTTFGGFNSTFKLPDLQGQFIRGLDRVGNIDYDRDGGLRNIGSSQPDSLQGHRHNSSEISFAGNHDHTVYVDMQNKISYGTNTFSSDNTAYIRIPRTPACYEENKDSSAYDFSSSVETTTSGNHSHKVSIFGVVNDSYGEVRVDSETRPTNIALIFCIKVK